MVRVTLPDAGGVAKIVTIVSVGFQRLVIVQ
jgi:hypothetical protein